MTPRSRGPPKRSWGCSALRGADRATGLPEPTPGLVRQLLVEDLPTFVYAPPGSSPPIRRSWGAGGTVRRGRRERIAGVVAESAPDFERAMNDPGNLTWHRWYASLLRTVGADLADPEDVRRRLAALDGAPLPDGVHRAHLMGRTALADVLLAEALTHAYVRDAEKPPASGPLLTDHAVATGIGRLAAALQDRWTAAGLAEQLAGPYARFAPGPDAFPHLVLADALLDEHLDYYGDPAAPAPPPPAIETGPVEEDADALIAAVEELAEEEFEPYGARLRTCCTRSTSAAAPPSPSPARPPSTRTGPSTRTWRTCPSPYRTRRPTRTPSRR
ncbi:hypothetical protein O1L60_31595 [Streptomyces diastatochromogenes]|nr:hypothetical protein [Streptomyces diastatochromogenes]